MRRSSSRTQARHRFVQRDAPGLGLVFVERTAHLVAVEVRGLDRLLHGHAELDDVEEELQEVLVLPVAALDREAQIRPAVLEREARRERDARALAGLEHVERALGAVEHEALHALAHPDAGAAGDGRRNPSAARRHGDDPALLVRRLNRRRAGGEALVERSIAGAVRLSEALSRSVPHFCRRS